MATSLTTNDQRYSIVEQVKQDFDEGQGNFYFFIGNHDPAVASPPDSNAAFSQTTDDVYKNMIAGKRITTNDVFPAIRNIPYVSSTVYDMYDDTDEFLIEKDFFVITNEGSFSHIYKCLDNNHANLSTVQPDFSHVSGSNSYIYQTSDGYRWKYMYSVDSATVLKFATTDYFPVIPNTAVTSGVIGGAIDIISVDGTGQKYDNYLTGTLSVSNIKVAGNNILYQVANTSASLINDFYTGCLMYLSSGPGAGVYEKIVQYISNTTGTYVVLNGPFSISPTNGSDYEIYPEVKVFGTGNKIVNCVARALVNALASNSIYRVEMLSRGSGYDFAYMANVVADNSVNIQLPAELRPINSPVHGHGYNAAQELFSNSVIISIPFSNTENNTIPATNAFKQIGIIRDPLFANVSVEFLDQVGNFAVGETAMVVKNYQVAINASINTTSTIISCNTADFTNQFANDKYLVVKTTESDAFQLATINSITDSSHIVISVNGYFSCTDAIIYKTTCLASAIVVSANNTDVLLANVMGIFSQNSQIIGITSGAYTQANTIFISDVAKGFDTFVQAYKYTGTAVSGQLSNNEYLIQTNPFSGVNASALIHSIEQTGSDISLYATKQVDNFLVGGTNTAMGNTSKAKIQFNETYPPELVFGSGIVLYYENVNEIDRSNTTTETFQTTIAF